MKRLVTKLTDRLFIRLTDIMIARADMRLMHPKHRLLLAAQEESALYATEHMSGAMIMDRREDVLRVAMDRMPNDGGILEFGVANGKSISFIAGLTGRPIHGFDSFEGLPDDWPGRHEERGHYSTGGRLPDVPSHVTLVPGLFEETLPAFLADDDRKAAFIHMDCDLYVSTRMVLEHLGPRIVVGTVIVFDEYFNHVGWRQNEFRAFQEFVKNQGVGYRYLCWGYQQAAVIITSRP